VIDRAVDGALAEEVEAVAHRMLLGGAGGGTLHDAAGTGEREDQGSQDNRSLHDGETRMVVGGQKAPREGPRHARAVIGAPANSVGAGRDQLTLSGQGASSHSRWLTWPSVRCSRIIGSHASSSSWRASASMISAAATASAHAPGESKPRTRS